MKSEAELTSQAIADQEYAELLEEVKADEPQAVLLRIMIQGYKDGTPPAAELRPEGIRSLLKLMEATKEHTVGKFQPYVTTAAALFEKRGSYIDKAGKLKMLPRRWVFSLAPNGSYFLFEGKDYREESEHGDSHK